jgi:hypothetical protein
MSAPSTIIELVERFERNLHLYKAGSYNETQVRREFIDPFFETLGWDVANKRGYAEAYKDVIHEFSLKTTDTKEAPDYCFRIGGTRNELNEKVISIMYDKQKLKLTRTPQEKTALQRQIESTDKQIDNLVYRLYGLTEEEIKIVEGE